VGIFWDVSGALIIAGASLEEAQRRGRFAHFPVTAEKMWRNYQHIGALPAEMDYYEPPGGRVVCDKVTRQFHLYADQCILKNHDLMKKIRKNLHLPLSIGGESDADYRCSACLGVTTSFSFYFQGSELILKGGGEMGRQQDAQ
jgi:hypothetical protein